jgi:hypothetical protein
MLGTECCLFRQRRPKRAIELAITLEWEKTVYATSLRIEHVSGVGHHITACSSRNRGLPERKD